MSSTPHPMAVSGPAVLSAAAPPTSRSNSYRDLTLGVFSLLLAFRVANALVLRTFFQPDEFFQSLEPAWQLAFGDASNAWITWEWKSQLRSSLHPALFAAVYSVAARVADLCGSNLPSRVDVLLAAPKVTQAVFAALLDCYTWKLAQLAYGRGSRTALTTLALVVCSPWQWFCSTRTLSNCLEATITTVAAFYWPWHWHGTARDRKTLSKGNSHEPQNPADDLGRLLELRLALLLAAFACVLRPTNALIWLSIAVPTLWQASKQRCFVLVREILFCGFVVLVCSIASDRLYYGAWTFPPVRFLYFNIAHSLAVFYGKNRADYYFTEGLPLLLTTALPFAVVGIVKSLQGNEQVPSDVTKASIESAVQRSILKRLAWTSLIVTTTMSLISHKEVRFLYPILPFLHILAAKPLSSFIPANAALFRKWVTACLLIANILIAGYASQVHQRGVIDVLSYLRHKHETRNQLSTQHGSSLNTTVGFLMPCHSTPWRSHLVHSQITAWALTCEPPLNVPVSERANYLDEADEFYIEPGPADWLWQNMQGLITIKLGGSRSGQHWLQHDPRAKRKSRRPWPQCLVFFEQLEETLKDHLSDTRYEECWRGFNTHFHDDSRRRGDVIVWCLDG